MNNSISKEVNTKEQTLKLIEGTFTKREALNIINNVVDVKINFHKVHRLSIQEGNENDECTFDNSRIKELMTHKKDTKAFLRALESNGQNIKISSTITISLEE
ncbi:hypothetical protein [Polaribacter porphyrae]|uniref:Uncharacterized protein n=1 Tax=Polaribacter porphyrae TaxID=1137780 RepID=A0A2S7WNJ4_9FLAO|nr:hypothetical protein [Polaribacter porphyrae]PQJ78882.1 hypothetical protein BTO18_06650 [Polaribacter porphyrae]